MTCVGENPGIMSGFAIARAYAAGSNVAPLYGVAISPRAVALALCLVRSRLRRRQWRCGGADLEAARCDRHAPHVLRLCDSISLARARSRRSGSNGTSMV